MDTIRQEHQESGFFCYSDYLSESFLKKVDQAFLKAYDLAQSHEGLQSKWVHESGNTKLVINVHRKFPLFTKLLRSKEVKTCIKSLYGDTPVYVTHSKISFKSENINQVWVPHQDTGYTLRLGEIPGTTICIFLEDCNRYNGTLEVFPKSHLLGRLKHQIFFVEGENEPQVRVARMPDISPYPIEGKQGSIHGIHYYTIHQSRRNSVGGYRCIFIFQVEPIGKLPPMEDDGRDAIVLNGENYQRTTPPYLPLIRRKRYVIEYYVRPLLKRLANFYYRMILMH